MTHAVVADALVCVGDGPDGLPCQAQRRRFLHSWRCFIRYADPLVLGSRLPTLPPMYLFTLSHSPSSPMVVAGVAVAVSVGINATPARKRLLLEARRGPIRC